MGFTAGAGMAPREQQDWGVRTKRLQVSQEAAQRVARALQNISVWKYRNIGDWSHRRKQSNVTWQLNEVYETHWVLAWGEKEQLKGHHWTDCRHFNIGCALGNVF